MSRGLGDVYKRQGYIHADYDKYVVINGVRVRRGSETKNWWGPVSAGVTLVWNIF